MARQLLSLLLLCALGVPRLHAQEASRSIPPDSAKRAAHTAVQKWLRHVDAGAWGTAWDEGASLLRDTGTREQWQTRGARVRDTLGTLRSRRLARAQYRDTLRQAPDAGPFVLLQYRSSFGGELYLETVLAVRAEDAWAVAGYEVAPIAVPANRRRTRPQQKRPD